MTSLDQHNAQTLTAISGMVHARLDTPPQPRPSLDSSLRSLAATCSIGSPERAVLEALAGHLFAEMWDPDEAQDSADCLHEAVQRLTDRVGY